MRRPAQGLSVRVSAPVCASGFLPQLAGASSGVPAFSDAQQNSRGSFVGRTIGLEAALRGVPSLAQVSTKRSNLAGAARDAAIELELDALGVVEIAEPALVAPRLGPREAWWKVEGAICPH